MAWAESIEEEQGGLKLLESSANYTYLGPRTADVQDRFGQVSGLAGCKSEKELRQAFGETVSVSVFITPGRTDLIGPMTTLSCLRFSVIPPDHPKEPHSSFQLVSFPAPLA